MHENRHIEWREAGEREARWGPVAPRFAVPPELARAVSDPDRQNSGPWHVPPCSVAAADTPGPRTGGRGHRPDWTRARGARRGSPGTATPVARRRAKPGI